MDLTLFAPGIQERILFADSVDGLEPMGEKGVRAVVHEENWEKPISAACTEADRCWLPGRRRPRTPRISKTRSRSDSRDELRTCPPTGLHALGPAVGVHTGGGDSTPRHDAAGAGHPRADSVRRVGRWCRASERTETAAPHSLSALVNAATKPLPVGTHPPAKTSMILGRTKLRTCMCGMSAQTAWLVQPTHSALHEMVSVFR